MSFTRPQNINYLCRDSNRQYLLCSAQNCVSELFVIGHTNHHKPSSYGASSDIFITISALLNFDVNVNECNQAPNYVNI